MIITQTPLRLSLLGGNTDFPEYCREYGGLVLTSTIDKYVYCIVKERYDEQIIVNYSSKEIVDSVDDLKHELVRESLRLLNIEKGLEISFLADIPTQGTGLGSSSAVTVGVLNALHTYLGESVPSWQLASEAAKIEILLLKKPIGIQDQYAVACGGIKTFEFGMDDIVTHYKLKLNESVREDFNNSLMLLYTGITRKSEEVLSSFNVSENINLLHQNKHLARTGQVALESGDLRSFAQMLDEYWELKTKMNGKVSNPEIDRMYKLAKEAGAVGGKVIGAGGGGFLLVMFPANKRAKVRNALKEYKELPFRFSDQGSKVIFNNG